jgi:hypothetical protein
LRLDRDSGLVRLTITPPLSPSCFQPELIIDSLPFSLSPNFPSIPIPSSPLFRSFIPSPLSSDWYAVCLGVRPQGNSTDRAQLGRETFLLPMTWLPSGWPCFNNNQSLALVEPGLYNRSLSATDYVDQFDGEKLDKSFYFLRTPYTKLYDLAARKGWLRVLGSPISIGDRDTPSLIM